MNLNFLICSILSFIPLYYVILKLRYKMLPLFVYINIFWIPYTFNGMRQGIAMSIFLMIIFTELNNFIKIILFFIGYGYHKSILIILIIYLFSRIISKKLNVRNINQITIIFFFIGIIFSEKIVNIVINFIPKLQFYSENFSGYSMKGIILRIILFLLFIYLKKYINNKKIKEVYCFYCVGIILYSFLISEYLFSTRINMFIRIVEIYLFTILINNIVSVKNKIFIFLILSMILGSVYIKEINMEANSPYRINPFFKELIIK